MIYEVKLSNSHPAVQSVSQAIEPAAFDICRRLSPMLITLFVNRPWLWFVLLGCLIGGGFIANYYRRQQHERYHDGVILAAAREYGVNAALVKAIGLKPE
jgi:hypothetical protein